MNKSSTPVAESPAQPEMLPALNGIDAEVDIEVLKVVPKKFSIEDEKSANWLVKKIIASRQYSARVREWCQQEIRRAEREEQTLTFLFGRQLEAWVRGEIYRLKGRQRSINLPAGLTGFTKYGPMLRVDDEDAVVKWARENCPAIITVQTITTLSRNELKAHFQKTGEVPSEGAHVEPGGERFFVREGRGNPEPKDTNSEQ